MQSAIGLLLPSPVAGAASQAIITSGNQQRYRRESKNMTRSLLLLLATSFLLGGCALTDPDGPNVSKFGPPDLFAKPVETVDIISALTGSVTSGVDAAGNPLDGAKFAAAFDLALRKYNPTQTQRNRLQDRLLLASNELCENYKVLLKKKQSRFNFWSGSVATVFGAAGGVVTGVDGARTLSALSGITSGVRAEYNEQYFSDLAAHVVTKGINSRRKEILQIIAAGRREPPESYTAEMAIADAITYHGACSLAGGLEQADSTLSRSTRLVGIDALRANPFFNPPPGEGRDESTDPAVTPNPPAAPAPQPEPEPEAQPDPEPQEGL